MTSKKTTPVGGSLLGPFSAPMTYYAPEYKGFMGVPRRSIHTPGWGAPFKTADGKPITPGTLGGPGQAALVNKKKGKWVGKRHPRAQKFGEVSWRGALKKPDRPDSGRYVLSYHGPKTRHFATPYFVYGSDSNHRNVYMEGGVVGVAPGAVLGACLQTISEKTYLTVVCLAPEGERVLRRVHGAPVYGNDSKALEKLAKFADDDFPGGWRVIGEVGIGGEYHTAKTPWFFNESGTEAQCIRQRDKEGTFNGKKRDEVAGDRFKLVLSGAVDLVPMGNLPPYKFKERGQVISLGEWESPPYNGYTHFWDEARLEVQATCTGEQVVAVDYDGDIEVLVKVVMDVDHSVYRDYMCGTDSLRKGQRPGYTPDPAYTNDDMAPVWTRYTNPYNIGVDPDKTYGNHAGSLWWGGSGTLVYLSYTLKGTEYRVLLESSGIVTESAYRELPENPQDKLAFFRYYDIQYLRHLDVRAGGLVVSRFEKYGEMVRQETYSTTVHETVDTDMTDTNLTVYLEGEEVHKKGKALYHRRLDWRNHESASDFTWFLVTQGIPNSGLSGGSTLDWWWDEPWAYEENDDGDANYKPYTGSGWWSDFGQPTVYPQPWDAGPWEWTADTYIGARPDNNDNCEIGNLPIYSFWPKHSERYRKGWYGLKLLYHDKHQETASFCQLADKAYILSGELPHPDTEEPTSFLVSEPEELSKAIDGPVYFPIGEL